MTNEAIYDEDNEEYSYYAARVEFSELQGKTLIGVSANFNTDVIIFECTDGTKYKMHHDQDCCEHVEIKDINGDLNDLIGNPILVAEARVSNKSHEGQNDEDSFTWTFYTIRNIKASIDISWFGSSNGYYSESVDFVRIK